MRTAAIVGSGLVAALLVTLLVVGALLDGMSTSTSSSGINTAAIPPLAAQSLDTITSITSTSCPELPPVWVIAHVQAESSWNPTAFSTDRNGGGAGLYQLNETNWREAGGAAWTSSPPPPNADVLHPQQHLRLAIPWVCRNLRTATAHLRATGKPTTPLDGMLVCHIAGCGRLTGSATGFPSPGEADCDTSCIELIRTYIDHVHALVEHYSAPAGPVSIDDLPAPTSFTGASTTCTVTDPTGGRCLTPATRHAHDEIIRAFGQPDPSAAIRSAGCWDPHEWNPDSDHSREPPVTTSRPARDDIPRGTTSRTVGDLRPGSELTPLHSG